MHGPELGANFLQGGGKAQNFSLGRGLAKFIRQFKHQGLGHGGHGREKGPNGLFGKGHNGGFDQRDHGLGLAFPVHDTQFAKKVARIGKKTTHFFAVYGKVNPLNSTVVQEIKVVRLIAFVVDHFSLIECFKVARP